MARFAKLHGVAHRTIRDITNRVTWKHLMPTSEELNSSKRELTDFDVRYIRTMYAVGVATQAELAREYDVSTTGVNRIIHRKTWKLAPNTGEWARG